MSVSGVRIVRLRPGCAENWARLDRSEDPAAIALAVLNDPDGSDSVMAGGLPLVWRQRIGRCNGEAFRVVESLEPDLVSDDVGRPAGVGRGWRYRYKARFDKLIEERVRLDVSTSCPA